MATTLLFLYLLLLGRLPRALQPRYHVHGHIELIQTHHAKYMTLLESAWTVMALAMAAGALSSLPPER